MSSIKKESTITLKIGLDENAHPQKITWHSDDNPQGMEPQEAKGMLISLFDKDHKDTFKIDLWTSELQIVEMDRFMYQTLRGLADTYFKATNNNELSTQMQQFVQYFGEKTQIIPTEES